MTAILENASSFVSQKARFGPDGNIRPIESAVELGEGFELNQGGRFPWLIGDEALAVQGVEGEHFSMRTTHFATRSHLFVTLGS